MIRGTARADTLEAVRRHLRGRRMDLREVAFHAILLLGLLVAIALLVTLLVDVFVEGAPVLAERGLDFLTSPNSSSAERAGVGQALSGSLLLMVFVVGLAFPLGVGAAVYLEEYARETRLTRLIRANVRNLAGVPSVVYGLLGLAIFVEAMGSVTGGLSVISGGLTLAILVLPIVVITTSEALRAVPAGIREASFAVGATRWETIRSQVLPAAAPGILTGTILSLARAFGETAPLLLVGAVTGFFSSGAQSLVERLQGSYTSLPTIVFAWASEPSHEFRALTAAAIVVLVGTLLVVNAVAIVLRDRFERRR